MSFNLIFGGRRSSYRIFNEIYKKNAIVPVVVDKKISFQIDWRNTSPETSDLLENYVMRVGMSSGIDTYLSSKVIGEGPKIFHFNQLDFEALEQMDINVDLAEYNQPFPTVVIELPENYGKKREVHCPQFGQFSTMTNKPDPQCHQPTLCVLTHLSEQKTIVIGVYLTSHQVYTTVLYQRQDVNTIEESICANIKRGHYQDSITMSSEEDLMCAAVVRSSINAILLMEETGIKRKGPANPSYYERLKKYKQKAEKNNKDKLPSINLDIKSHPILYELNQNVKIYDKESNIKSSEGHTGIILKSHWRKGHYRQQRFGVGLSQCKRIRIKPVMVNPHLFLGDSGDTKVTYHD